MADTPTITRSAQVEADLSQIRTAVYGREVREAIANGIEHCYDDNQAAIGNANEAITAANTAAGNANLEAGNAAAATRRANNAATAAENVNATASKVQDGPYQITVTNSQGNSSIIEIPDPAAAVKKKANLEAVTVKKTVGPAEMVTFEDGVDAPAVLTKIKLEPKQDLHGYDHPWVGGAGKNLLPQYRNNTTISDTNFNWDDQGVLTISNLNTGAIRYDLVEGDGMLTLAAGDYILSGGMAGNPESNNIRIQLRRTQTSSVTDTIIAQCYPTQTSVNFTLSETTSFYPVLFVSQNTTAAAFPMVWKPMITLASETDQSYEPYSNICPIEGYDAVEVTRIGKNLLPRSAFPDRDGSGVTTTWMDDGTLRMVMTSRTTQNRWGLDGGQYVTHFTLPAGTYTIYRNLTTPSYGFRLYNLTDIGNLPSLTNGQSAETANMTLTKTTDISCSITGNVGDTGEIYAKLGIYYSNEYSAKWEPPMDDTYTISLAAAAGTIYGGELTLNEDGSGTIVADWFGRAFDGTEKWTSNRTNVPFVRTAELPNGNHYPAYVYVNNNTDTDMLTSKCSHYENGSVTTTTILLGKANVYHSGNNDYPYIQFRPLNAADYGTDVYANSDDAATHWAQELATAYNEGHPLTIAYKMKTPISYDLTATQVQTLVGTNHVWTDAGEITLTYRSDKYAELERRISQLEALVLES